MLKLILCDLGNVLINFDHRIAVRKIMPYTAKSFDEVYQLFFDSKLTRDFEEGRLAPRDFFRKLCRLLGIKGLSFDKFVPIWNEIFSDNKPMALLLGALKKKHKLHLISNINKLHYEYIAERFARSLRLFNKVYLSYEVGFCKPHVRIYRKAMHGAGARPNEVLYIDDRADLIKEAKKLGLRPVLFKNVSDLKRKLKKMKVSF